jgi:mannose-6-phosphate isomerase-like protein (cupin superfamily)
MLEFFRADLATEFDTPERCSIVELLNDARVPALSVARCRVEPGVTTQLHSLTDTDEVYVILNGQGLMGDGVAVPQPVAALDCVHIPAGHPQQVENTGSDPLIFLAICSDRFTADAYVSHERGVSDKSH